MTGPASLLLLIVGQVAAPAPSSAQQSVQIDQVGDATVTATHQTGSRGTVRIEQDGDRNMADVAQMMAPPGYRPDDTAEASVSIYQRGSGNAASVRQFGMQGLMNEAILSQDGSGNIMRLEQSGAGNRAELEQTGDGNAMDARQIGDGNVLRWTQTGSGLPDLGITQTGGQTMAIRQTVPGR